MPTYGVRIGHCDKPLVVLSYNVIQACYNLQPLMPIWTYSKTSNTTTQNTKCEKIKLGINVSYILPSYLHLSLIQMGHSLYQLQ